MGINPHGGENSSSQVAAHVADAEGVQKRASDVAERKGGLNPFGNNFNLVTVGDVNASDSTKSAVGVVSVNSNLDGKQVQELNDVVVVNVTSEREASTADVRQHSSIRSSVEDKSSRVDCDVTKGRWVLDESYPLYTHVTCPFIDEGFNCDGNGRLDKDYMKWRWQPQDCDIPR